MTPTVYDDRRCILGEGPLWHPLRRQLFWFDIMRCRLLSRRGGAPLDWSFGHQVSAAGWIDDTRLLIAGETGLFRFDLDTGAQTPLCAIEAENPRTRSNDGRADPWGGFWVGTMGKAGEAGAGALYRWHDGVLRQLRDGMTTPNAICFDRERQCAYFADTRERLIWRQPLDPRTGWPVADCSVFLDLRATDREPEHKPDGAVIDSEGCLWNAQWGSARVARYSPEGDFLQAIALPTGHTSCPAFGSDDLSVLFITTASQKLPENAISWKRTAGQTLAIRTGWHGSCEPQVIC